MNMGVIGCGYWNNYVRLLSENESVKQVYAFDLKSENLIKVMNDFPSVKCGTDYRTCFDELAAVIVCTPSSTHYKIAKDCLERGLHVLIEKPMAETIGECVDLIRIANEKNVLLCVGHTYEYNTYAEAVKEAIKEGVLGDVKYCTFNRVGNSPLRSDVNCAADLMVHDFSMAISWFGMPKTIQTSGKSFLQKDIEDVAFAVCEWSNGMIAQFTSSWINPVKERVVKVIGTEGMVMFDDIKKSVVFSNDYIFDGVINPPPLWRQVNNFIMAINGHEELYVTGEKGCDVVKLLHACNYSLKNNSEKVYL